MTERAAGTALTVGQVAERFGVTVRTLHHYDEIGLVRPHRTASGYRVYTDDDLERLRHVVVYRRLGFPLEEIGPLLDDPHADVEAHLRRQRAAVVTRLDEMRDLVAAIDRALEARMNGNALTPDEQKELFGEGFSEEYAREAEQRWGDTDAWRQSRERAGRYGKDDWRRIAAEGEEVTARFVALTGRARRRTRRRRWTPPRRIGSTSTGGSTTSGTPCTGGWRTCTSPTHDSRRPMTTVRPVWRSTCTTRSTPTPTGTNGRVPSQSRSNRSARPCRSSRTHSANPWGSRRVTRKYQANRGNSSSPTRRIPGLLTR